MTERRFTLSWTVEGQDVDLRNPIRPHPSAINNPAEGAQILPPALASECRRPQRTIGEGLH